MTKRTRTASARIALLSTALLLSSTSTASAAPSNKVFRNDAVQMARVAKVMYRTPAPPLNIHWGHDDRPFTLLRRSFLNLAHVWHRNRPLATRAGYIIGIRGTDLKDETTTSAEVCTAPEGQNDQEASDAWRDVQHAVLTNPINPWTEQQYTGKVTLGAQNRAVSILQGEDFIKLQDDFLTEDKPLTIFVTGHSLGASSGQLVAFYIAKWLESEGVTDAKVYNFAFNTPKAANQTFATEFANYIKNGSNFRSYNFTRKGDFISKLGTISGLAWDRPNANTDDIVSTVNVNVGYCINVDFDEIIPIRQEISQFCNTNHSLDLMIDSIRDKSQWNSFTTCMKKKYTHYTF